MEKLPVYEVKVDDEKSELHFVSIVETPAIMEVGLAFSKNFKFATDKEKQVLIGPAMIPDLPLYRKDEETGFEYYVVFTKESIEKLAEKFNKKAQAYKINVEHDKVVESAYVKSNWIIEDAVHDKSKIWGFNFPVGTWMLEVKVDDEDFWRNEVKSAGRFGFSVEGDFEMTKINNTKQHEMKHKFKELKQKFEELTPEEKAEIMEVIAVELPAEVAPEVVEEVAEAVIEVVEEQMTEGIAEEESFQVDESAVMALVQPLIDAQNAKIEELMMMIAEMKAGTETPAEEVATTSEFSTTRAEFIRQFRRKYDLD